MGGALVSAGAALVPLPGVDVLVDLRLLSRLITRINSEFGLKPEQIARLPMKTKAKPYQAIVGSGATLIGKVVTHELVLRALPLLGSRISFQQLAGYLVVGGQTVSAGMSWGAMWYVGERHIRDCVRAVASSAPCALCAG